RICKRTPCRNKIFNFHEKNSSKITAPIDEVYDTENENCHHMLTAKKALPATFRQDLRRFYG
ncbi:hypothetical protein, partial [Agathobacter rectalis]|uniref:hypothetical protein n=1 Tax=Agathobacter rectalis TaxID=39491 RepID=UPI0027D2D990